MGAVLLAMNRDKVSASAQKLLQSGKYDKAVLELKKLVEDDPKDVRTLLRLGDTYVKMGARADAIAAYQQVANVYAEQGFFLKAVAVYKQMLRVDAAVADIHMKLAEMYQQLGLTNDSKQHYEQVAVLYEQQGRSAETLDVLKRMVDLEPENLPSRIKLAELFAKKGQHKEALAEFRFAADFLKTSERHDDYIRVAERLVYFDPGAVDVTRDLARLYLARGEAKAALGKLQNCFKVDPRNLEVLSLIAEAFLAMQQVVKTISVYKEMARILESSSRHDEAQTYWRRVLDLVPDDGESQQALGLVGVPTAAPVVAAAPPQVNPEEEQLARLLTETDVYLKYGLRDKALDHLQRVFALRPDHLEAHAKLRDIHQAMGNRGGLVDVLRRLVVLGEHAGDPRTETWRRELGLIDGAPASHTARPPVPPAPPPEDDMVVLDDGLEIDGGEGDFGEPTLGTDSRGAGSYAATLPPDEDLSGVDGEAVQVGHETAPYEDEGDELLLVSGPSDAYPVDDEHVAVDEGFSAVEDVAYEAFGSGTGAFAAKPEGEGGVVDDFDEVGDFMAGAASAQASPGDVFGDAEGGALDDAGFSEGAGLDDAAAEAMRLLDEGFDTPGVENAAFAGTPDAAFDDDAFASAADLPPEFGQEPSRPDAFASTEIMSLSPEELAGLRAMARGPNPPSVIPSDEAPATEFVPVQGVASGSLLQSRPDPVADDTGFDDGASYAESDAAPVDGGLAIEGDSEFGDSTVAMALPDMEALGRLSAHSRVSAARVTVSEEARGFDDAALPLGEDDAEDGAPVHAGALDDAGLLDDAALGSAAMLDDAAVFGDDALLATDAGLGAAAAFGNDAGLDDAGLLDDAAQGADAAADAPFDEDPFALSSPAAPATFDDELGFPPASPEDAGFADEASIELSVDVASSSGAVGVDASDPFAEPFVDGTAAAPLALASDEFSFVSDDDVSPAEDDEFAADGGEFAVADAAALGAPMSVAPFVDDAAAEAPAEPPPSVDERSLASKLGVSEQARGFEDDPAADFFPEELEEAEFFIKQDLLDEAKEILLEIQENVPESARVAHMLARIEAKENGEPEPPAPWEQKIIAEVEESIGDLAEAVAELVPQDEMQVSVEEVLEQFKRGVKEAIGDDDAETHYNLGIAYREMGLVDEAISEFELAARAPGKAADAHHLIGLTHADHGRHAVALAAFDAALAALGGEGDSVVKKQRGVNEYQRGVCFEALDKPGEALQAYRRARELGSDMRDLADRISRVTERLVGGDGGLPLAGGADDGAARKKNIDYL